MYGDFFYLYNALTKVIDETMWHYWQNDYFCIWISWWKGKIEIKQYANISLLLCFMSISIVKAIHVHNADGTIGIFRTDAGQTDTGSDDDNNCPICHFSLFPFIESPTFHITFSPHLLSFLLVCPLVAIEKKNRLSSSSRAPPVARLS